jgi:hypothetical protein
MKTIRFFSVVMLLSAFVLVSCSETADMPSIKVTELGHENTKTVYAGGELHIEADIKAPKKIARIVVEIHPEGEHAKVSAMKAKSANEVSAAWEFEKTYTGKYAGVKNTEFHEHIDVPLSAAAGHYEVHITVVDMEGNTVEFKDEIEVKIQSK